MIVSYLLVFFQFLLLSLLFWPLETRTFDWAWLPSSVALLVSFLLLLWTAKHNRIGNFNIIPEIRQSAKLIKSGPYRFIRHPMYTSVILIGLSLCIYWFHLYKTVILLLLITVLFLKARKEEKLWSEEIPSYKAYKETTGMFLPTFFKR